MLLKLLHIILLNGDLLIPKNPTTVQFQTSTPTTQQNVPSLAYSTAENTQTQSIRTFLPPNQFFLTVLHTYFSTKFRTTFNFIEAFTEDKPDTCATLIQNTTHHIATLPTGNIGYIEVPITNEKPKYYHVNDINTLIHNVTHTYHHEITEIFPQTNYPSQYKDDTVRPFPSIFTTPSIHDKS